MQSRSGKAQSAAKPKGPVPDPGWRAFILEAGLGRAVKTRPLATCLVRNTKTLHTHTHTHTNPACERCEETNRKEAWRATSSLIASFAEASPGC